MAKREPITVIDLGAANIRALVAEIDDEGRIHITGIGVEPSAGIKKGVVVDIAAAANAVEAAATTAARDAGRDIEGVYVGVTGEHISSLNSTAHVAITRPSHEITAEDVARVNESARAIVLPPDRSIVQAIPRSYMVDGQSGVMQPIGMSGSRLGVELHIIHGATASLQNVDKCVTQAGLEVIETVLESVASAEAVLQPDEKELGVCLVDIGGGTTNVGVFREGEIYFSAVIPVGGSHVTNDVAFGLTVSHEEAERLKTDDGCALLELVSEEDVISVRQIGRGSARKLRRTALVQIIEARMAELFQLVQEELELGGCRNMYAAGVVLTGGGSLLGGCAEAARKVFDMPVRIGRPQGDTLPEKLSHPTYATAVGLLEYAARVVRAQKPPLPFGSAADPARLVGRARRWLNGVFGAH